MDYLNESATFTCNQGGTIKCSEPGNTKAKYNNKLLTTCATVKSCSGICAILTARNNSPTKCQCSLTAWTNPSSVVSACGSPCLTQNSKNTCVNLGTISVLNSGVNGKVYKGSGVSSEKVPFALAGLAPIKPLSDKLKDKQGDAAKPKDTSSTSKDTNGIAENSKEKENKNKNKNKQDSNSLCPGCDKQDTCEYLKASTEVNNNSIILRRNYEQKLAQGDVDGIDSYYQSLLQSQSQYTYVAHHIISGNQVFKQFPEIVKLANFYKYDINNAINCIMLVSKQDEYGNNTDFSKKVSGYDAMGETLLQWHLGGHSYSFSSEEIDMLKKNIPKKTGKHPQNGLKNYMQLVYEEVAKISEALSQNKVCRDTPQQKSAFIKRMNNISRKIRAELMKFREHRWDSYPYYVSKTAYIYAFAVPQMVKIAIIRETPNGYSVDKRRFSHSERQGSDFVSFKIVGNGDSSNIQYFTNSMGKECISFCENIEHFVFVGYAKPKLLPFKPEFEFYVYGNKNTDEFLSERDTQLLTWLSDNPSEYVAPMKKIKQRLDRL